MPLGSSVCDLPVADFPDWCPVTQIMRKYYNSSFLSIALASSLVLPIAAMAQTESESGQASCPTEEQMALVGQDIDAVQETLPEQSRIIPPDTAVTQDFLADRVNVDLDEDGVVIRVWCG